MPAGGLPQNLAGVPKYSRILSVKETSSSSLTWGFSRSFEVFLEEGRRCGEEEDRRRGGQEDRYSDIRRSFIISSSKFYQRIYL